jgi:energy-coupling factor transporter transmembrane protein EcfT
VTRRASNHHLLRLVPHTSPVHRLGAATKLFALMAFAVTLSVAPTWPAVLVIGATVGLGVAIARIPIGAVPRPPRWFIAMLVIGGALALLAGGHPTMRIGGVSVGLGGLSQWARAMAIGVTVITAAMLLSWTTPLSEVAPALSRLVTPLCRVRLPVDEWVAATALALRCLPLLLDEIETMVAARRLRVNPPDDHGQRHRAAVGLLSLLATILVVSVRRAREVGDAIEARGGWGGAEGGRARFSWRDVVALAVVALAAATPLTVLR